MPRIRTIKPEIWQDEKLAPLQPLTRLVFVGLISMADDAGRLVDNIKSIDGFLFPETKESSREPLDILARIGRIIRYTSSSGQKLIQITNWDRHQKVDKPAKYTLPAPSDAQPQEPQQLSEESRDSRESLAGSSRSDLLPTTYYQRPTTISLVSDADEFETCWSNYPKRSGSNSKRDALRAYQARRQLGVSTDDLLAGTKRYAAYCETVEKTGTEFVMQGSRFFGPSEPFRESWEPPTTSGNGRGRGNGKMSPSERIDATMAEATLKGQPAWMTAKIPC